MHQVWEEERVPKDWADAILVPVPKVGNLTSCDNRRGIALLDMTGKVVARVIQMNCSYHHLRLASIKANDSVLQIIKFFGMLLNLWKLFITPQKAQKLKEQAVLNLPELTQQYSVVV